MNTNIISIEGTNTPSARFIKAIHLKSKFYHQLELLGDDVNYEPIMFNLLIRSVERIKVSAPNGHMYYIDYFDKENEVWVTEVVTSHQVVNYTYKYTFYTNTHTVVLNTSVFSRFSEVPEFCKLR